MTFSTLVDLVKVYTPTSGQGALTLGAAVPGFLTPSTVNPAMTSGAVVSYGINDPSGNEVGQGILTLTGSVWTLTRGVTQSSNGGAPILCTGQATVALTLRAEDVLGKSGVWQADPGVTLNFRSDASIILDAPLITAAGSDGMSVQSAGTMNVGTNDSSGGSTSRVQIKSGNAGGGNSGDVELQTGTASDTRGNIILDANTVTTPDAASGTSGGLLLQSGNATSAAGSGFAGLSSGDSAAADTGDTFLGSGNTLAGSSGASLVYTGNAAGAGKHAGNVTIAPGTGTDGATAGNITIVAGGMTGPASVGGDVTLQGGPGATAGNIILANLPTSASGLPTGALWNSSGVLHIA